MKHVSLRPLDICVICISVAAVAFSTFAVYAGSGASGRVSVQGAYSAWVFPLDAEEMLRVPGPLGETVIHIGGGAARILSSPCANQTCVAHGAIHAAGQWAACLPNRVIAAVEAAPLSDGIDAATW